jgi:phytoene synthase
MNLPERPRNDPLLRGSPPGSLRHFAVLYAPSEARTTLAALYALEAEIEDTVSLANHEVAHTRLHWWRGEIDRLIAGRPQHPVTRALAPLREVAASDLPLLHEALVAADIDLARMTFTNEAELEAYCYRASGSLQTLAAAASAGRAPSSEERDFARKLGSAVRRTEQLRDLRGLIGAGRVPLPLDVLHNFSVDPQRLAQGPLTVPFAQWLVDRREQLVQQLGALQDCLSAEHRSAQRHGLVLAALYRELARRIVHRGELARTRVEVRPWTRLWTAWRTAVRHR